MVERRKRTWNEQKMIETHIASHSTTSHYERLQESSLVCRLETPVLYIRRFACLVASFRPVVAFSLVPKEATTLSQDLFSCCWALMYQMKVLTLQNGEREQDWMENFNRNVAECLSMCVANFNFLMHQSVLKFLIER